MINMACLLNSNSNYQEIMANKLAKNLCFYALALAVTELALIPSVMAQSSQQTANPNSTIGNNSEFNTVIQTPNQNNAQNQVNFSNILPLNNPIYTPVNTENDLGLNLSVAVNTLDSANVTLFLGLIYQPGRTDDHKARMARLRAETAVLESQKELGQAQLQLLQKQIAEAEYRLQKLQQSSPETPPQGSDGSEGLKNP
ncbi:hypothetical protein C7B64_15375 [Merismopedia glauca CCAP 1448/3]|uniref:Uncharacterized protein n=2 Tax=Merismopedia TaxID=53402 RepID=A0A2T1C1K0_9CYAN|nr:hypothetical protein C7B64_15375 [Merismopedia glauca CCAP 1448/3]